MPEAGRRAVFLDRDGTIVEDRGFLHEPEARAAIDALATEGLLESALVAAAVAEAEDMLGE